jgi:hypothetical protein
MLDQTQGTLFFLSFTLHLQDLDCEEHCVVSGTTTGLIILQLPLHQPRSQSSPWTFTLPDPFRSMWDFLGT